MQKNNMLYINGKKSDSAGGGYRAADFYGG